MADAASRSPETSRCLSFTPRQRSRAGQPRGTRAPEEATLAAAPPGQWSPANSSARATGDAPRQLMSRADDSHVVTKTASGIPDDGAALVTRRSHSEPATVPSNLLNDAALVNAATRRRGGHAISSSKPPLLDRQTATAAASSRESRRLTGPDLQREAGATALDGASVAMATGARLPGAAPWDVP